MSSPTLTLRLVIPSLGLCLLFGAGCVGEASQAQNNDTSAKEAPDATASSTGSSPTSGPDMDHAQADGGDGADLAPSWAQGPWDRYLDSDYNPNTLAQETLFSGGKETENGAITLGRLRRLEQREMVRNAGRWFPSRRSSTATAQNPFEVRRPHIGYSTYSEGEGVGQDALAQLLTVLPDATSSWVHPTGRLMLQIEKNTDTISQLRAASRLRFAPLSQGVRSHLTYACMKVARGDQPTRECVEAFAQVYLRKDVLRQPPGAEDVQKLTDYILDAFQGESATMDAEQILEAVAHHTRRGNSTGRLPQALAGDQAMACLEATDTLAPPTPQCVKDFVAFYLQEAVYFRPPTPQELEDLEAMALELHKELPAGAYDAEARSNFVEVIASAAWLGAPALFRQEVGSDQPDARGRVALGPWEAAGALGFALARRSPGAPAALISGGGSERNRQWSIPEDQEGLGYLPAFEQAAREGTIGDRAHLALLIRQAATGVDEDRRDLPVELQDGEMRSNRDKYWVAEGIERFFREWLEVDHFATAFKDTPEATSKYQGSAVRHIAGSYAHLQSTGEYSDEPMYLEQLDDMIARIVQEDTEVLENLLTSRTFYTPRGVLKSGNVAREQKPQYVYNIEVEHDGSRDNRRRTLPATERAGVLTHPVWLGAHSSNFENGTAIIYRGKWVRERLLCGVVPPVTDDIDAALVEGEGKGGRQRVEESTEGVGTSCAGCHSLMNSLGKPFEMYNHAGFLRAFDTRDGQQIPPDGSSTLTAMPAAPSIGPLAGGTTVTDAIDFVQRAADSQYVKRCFIRQTFRYFMGRSETEFDAYTLSQMELSYDMSRGSFVEMLVTLLTSDAFLMRLPLSVLNPKEDTP